MENCILVSSYNETMDIYIKSEEDLLNNLKRLTNKENLVFTILFDDENKISFGLGLKYGFVEFINENFIPPYLMGKNKSQPLEEEQFIVFDSGGTPTPIPIHYCLPIELVYETLIFYFNHNKLSEKIEWEII